MMSEMILTILKILILVGLWRSGMEFQSHHFHQPPMLIAETMEMEKVIPTMRKGIQTVKKVSAAPGMSITYSHPLLSHIIDVESN